MRTATPARSMVLRTRAVAVALAASLVVAMLLVARRLNLAPRMHPPMHENIHQHHRQWQIKLRPATTSPTPPVCWQVRSSQLHGPVSNAQAADLLRRILASVAAESDKEGAACPLRRRRLDHDETYVSWRPNNKRIGDGHDSNTRRPTTGAGIPFATTTTPVLEQGKRTQICTDQPDFCESLYPPGESDRIAQLMYGHQNPRDCTQARFLVLTKEWHSGLGSNIHVKAWMLLVAIMAKRVLIDSSSIAWDMTNPSNCPQQDWSCYFAPVSRCSLPEDWDESKAPEFDVSDLKTDTFESNRQYVRTQAHPQPLDGTMVMGYLDAQRLEGFDGGGGDGSSSEYATKPNSWWMTHATVYLLRPNKRTLDVACWYWRCMSSLKHGHSSQNNYRHESQSPQLTASIFVRSGDKWKEANLRTAREHFDALDAFVQSNPALRPNLVYFGTDDALVLSDVVRQYSAQWNLTWIGYHREATGLTFEEFKTRYYSAKVEWQVLASLADLYISSLADIFVGSLSSNWCRLVDEFRKVHGKVGLPYLTPSGEAMVAGV